MGIVIQTEPVTTYSYHIFVIIELCKSISQTTNQGVNSLFCDTDSTCTWPDNVDDGVSIYYGSSCLVEGIK
jgi:hypothetical protein